MRMDRFICMEGRDRIIMNFSSRDWGYRHHKINKSIIRFLMISYLFLLIMILHVSLNLWLIPYCLRIEVFLRMPIIIKGHWFILLLNWILLLIMYRDRWESKCRIGFRRLRILLGRNSWTIGVLILLKYKMNNMCVWIRRRGN
jgi:hypothetical protein